MTGRDNAKAKKNDVPTSIKALRAPYIISAMSAKPNITSQNRTKVWVSISILVFILLLVYHPVAGYDTLNYMSAIVDVQGFSLKFGEKTVIKDLSFQVNKGEVFGFLGSNGSGKTTTIRSLLGLYEPTGGSLTINGRPFEPSGTSSTIGYLPEERGLYKKEKVIDVMRYFGELKGLTRVEATNRSLKYLKRVGLSDYANTRLDKLSGGQQQKIQLGVTIISNPELLILDEPTKGFDPVNRRLLMDIIEEHRQAGAAVIFITHQMEEVERLCDRILLLKDGTAQAYGTVKDVRKKFGNKSLDDIFIQVYGDENQELHNA